MPLSAGDTLGRYEILAPIGAGGMGEVYRARDPKLKRDVALKVLPEAFAADAGRMMRFEREAEVLASLNHPNIAQIYGMEDRALVMELVEGESPKGPMPFDEAWKIAMQIADALEYAHERGVIHRDLKPANVMVTPDGVVKLLDFGLARAFSAQAEASASGSAENSPTLTLAATEAGMILGTAAYMAPEQARGKRVDKRADIWSWGVVLYELLTGDRLFQGDNTADTLAQVLTKELDPAQVPPQVRKLLQRCLEKDPKKRLRDIGDARELLQESTPEASGASRGIPGPPVRMRGRAPWVAATAVLGLLSLGLIAVLWRAARPVELPLTRLSVDLGPDAMAGLNLTTAISPDGRRLVFPERTPNGTQQLATRLLEQTQATLLPGTENGKDPFFSPDSQWIGFFADGQLKKIPVQGGAAPVTLCAAPLPHGASWGDDGSIVAALYYMGPLYRVPAAGGTPRAITKLAFGEVTQRWPQFLPGSEVVLFTGSWAVVGYDNANIEALSLKTGQVKVLERGGYDGRYVSSGHLVYVHQNALYGAAFDPAKLEVRGTPTPIVEDLAADPLNGAGLFNVSGATSGSGTLVYLAGTKVAQPWQLDWLESSGKRQPIPAAAGAYAEPRLSPDGRKLAFLNANLDVFVYDFERNTATRLTTTGGADVPVWTPDGKHIVFQSDGSSLVWIRSDGAGEPLRLLTGGDNILPWSFSPDGSRLAYRMQNPETGGDLWTLSLDLSDPEHPKAGAPEVFLRTPANENLPTFSSDGHWIAYRSDESGSNEIYVRPFPAASGGKWQISTDGGIYAFWSKNGKELFYEAGDGRIMVVDYKVDGSSFTPGKPRLWSEKPLIFAGSLNLDLAPDGKRLLVLTAPATPSGEKDSVHVTFLLNFFDELRRRVPGSK